jgi:UDP-N-acetyl-D-mannosaminuronic acid transferase (WecB/TagA/CpsF family)
MIKLFNVNLPQITKWELKEKLVNLPDRKTSLYWYYSEFLLRANRNPWYKKVLNEGSISAIDGKGLHWAMWKIMQSDLIPALYGQKLVYLPIVFRIPVFCILFLLQLISNLFNGVYNLVIAKTNFTKVTKNETILGRDFTYDILKICSLKGYKTMIIGGSNEDDTVSKGLINQLYPDLDLVLWTRKTNSLLMMDKQGGGLDMLTTFNLFEKFPDLLDAKRVVREENPDVILTCIGGASGKQEFFIDNLMKDEQCNFKLATGLGAAIDHLGGGKQQSLPPHWAQKMGLEWLFRFFNQPYRRMRIIDSIFTLYWWTTLEQFIKEIEDKTSRENVAMSYLTDDICSKILTTSRNKIRAFQLPVSQIEENQSIEEAGIQELLNNYQIKLGKESIISVPEKGREVAYPINLLGFILRDCRYTKAQYYINFFKLPKTLNYELLDLPTGASFEYFDEVSNKLNPNYIQQPGKENLFVDKFY